MKPKLLTTLTAALLALSAWATEVKIGGIYYNLDSDTNTASVTSGDSNYQGDITIPSSVTYDGTTYSVTSIGSLTFYGCTSLTSINIPNSVTSIGDRAFYGCTGLTSINIPESVTSIGAAAFEGCEGLEDIYALRTDPAAYDCATDAFSDYSATLHVPAGSKEAYASTETWSNFANIVEEEDLTAIQPLTLTPSEAGQAYYNLQGQRITMPQHGQLVIIRYADGTSRKVVVD